MVAGDVCGWVKPLSGNRNRPAGASWCGLAGLWLWGTFVHAVNRFHACISVPHLHNRPAVGHPPQVEPPAKGPRGLWFRIQPWGNHNRPVAAWGTGGEDLD